MKNVSYELFYFTHDELLHKRLQQETPLNSVVIWRPGTIDVMQIYHTYMSYAIPANNEYERMVISLLMP